MADEGLCLAITKKSQHKNIIKYMVHFKFFYLCKKKVPI